MKVTDEITRYYMEITHPGISSMPPLPPDILMISEDGYNSPERPKHLTPEAEVLIFKVDMHTFKEREFSSGRYDVKPVE